MGFNPCDKRPMTYDMEPDDESDPCATCRLDESEAERDALKAARIAYASEFPLNSDGEPDVGSIHQNIRALKAKLARVREIADAAAKEEHSPAIEKIRAILDAVPT